MEQIDVEEIPCQNRQSYGHEQSCKQQEAANDLKTEKHVSVGSRLHHHHQFTRGCGCERSLGEKAKESVQPGDDKDQAEQDPLNVS